MDGPYGTKGTLRLRVQALDGWKKVTFPALVSKNPKPNEKPFRLSWFKLRGNVPTWSGHVSITKPEAEVIVRGKIPQRVWLYLVRGFNAQDVEFVPGIQEGRDDVKKLPLPPEAKAYARRKGLASMKRQPQDFINMVASVTNQKHLKAGFKNTDSGGKVPHAFKESAAQVVTLMVEGDDDDLDFKEVYDAEKRDFQIRGETDYHTRQRHYDIQVPAYSGMALVNKVFIPPGTHAEDEIKMVEERLAVLARERQFPEDSRFHAWWGSYLIQNRTIKKIGYGEQ
jgi:hypothetical protein